MTATQAESSFAAPVDPMEAGKAYLRVYALLVQTAEMRGLVNYKHIARIMGLPETGNLMSQRTGKMLGLIVERERACGRPMLSAVTVSSTNWLPGDGFFGIAKDFGLIPAGASKEERLAFWRAERDRVYEAWSS